jgi:hypothetical protein
MRPLSARSDALELRDPEDGGDSGTGDDGLRSSVTCISDAPAFGAPQATQNRPEDRRLLPQLAQKGMTTRRFRGPEAQMLKVSPQRKVWGGVSHYLCAGSAAFFRTT